MCSLASAGEQGLNKNSKDQNEFECSLYQNSELLRAIEQFPSPFHLTKVDLLTDTT